MKREYGRCVWAVVVILTGAAIAFPAPAQGYNLTGASLGTSSGTVEIPNSGNAQIVLPLRVFFSGGGANCTTGNLSSYWNGNGKDPAGVIPGFSNAGMSQSTSSRTIAINVYSTAQPMASRAWTIVIPRGSCGGSNQTVSYHLTLTKKH